MESKNVLAAVVAALAMILAIALWLLMRYVVLNRRRSSDLRRVASEGRELRFQYSFFRRVAGLPTKYSLRDLDRATDNFRWMLGRGASGAVFKGVLDDGTPVAVKRIEGAEYGEKQFKAEIAAVASVQHVHLLRLLGYCHVNGGGGGPCFLVYDYIENGSLDEWIFPSPKRQRGLTWPLRYRVAVDVARGLAYLHHDCRARVLHLDIKPENILLDDEFRAVVADFGLSKLMNRDQSRIVASMRGTKGYLAPEWLLGTGISEKSDVYSYGMVLLELVGGRRNVRLVEDGGGEGRGKQSKWSYFPKTVMEKVREGRLMEVVDERLQRAADQKQVTTMVHVALWCIQERAELRPTMTAVVEMLEGKIAAAAPPPETDMLVVDLLSIMDDNGQSSTTSVGNIAANEETSAAVRGGKHAAFASSSTNSFAISYLSGR
ncbi:probable receptor-like protein kinase At5g20050 [Zingiber officinale]|uniref:Protein kinase domain-containing protein n=1 Tax=Zingiber officinale TaxID=94328 RepID=A0A8J5INU8_ZINOF|nr:probable receptor-like protein kinase At5g20050 [Zingiber officinale]KAG6539030.1 hypothetical protein ZIOFF_004182 [Zingiber officinale]